MNIPYLIPSFYGYMFNGALLVIALFLIILNFSKIMKLDSYKIIKLLLLFSLAVGMHGLSHLGMETVYGYNPLLFGKISHQKEPHRCSRCGGHHRHESCMEGSKHGGRAMHERE